MRMPPLLHADALSYIAQGIRIAHAEYLHHPRQAFLSTMQTISITRTSTCTIASVSRTTYHLHCFIASLLHLVFSELGASPCRRVAVTLTISISNEIRHEGQKILSLYSLSKLYILYIYYNIYIIYIIIIILIIR